MLCLLVSKTSMLFSVQIFSNSKEHLEINYHVLLAQTVFLFHHMKVVAHKLFTSVRVTRILTYVKSSD